MTPSLPSRTARRRLAVRLSLGLLVAAVAASGVSRGGAVAAQSTRLPAPDATCNIQTSERIVAIGDVHGAFDSFVATLRAAQLVDHRNRWTGRKAVLVQTGDILDRGADSRRAVDLLRRLERDARRAGGQVISLLGNHELMRLIDDWRYVSTGELDAFKTGDSAALRETVLMTINERNAQRAKTEGREHDAAAFRAQFLEDVPLGMIEMRQAFGPTGEYGRWIRARPAVARVNGIVFLHGGISPEIAPLGCAGINGAVQKEMASLPLPPEQLMLLMSLGETGPLWFRGLATEPEDALAATLPTTLQQMQARAIVIGHTTVQPGRIVPRLGGRVVQIDSGMLDGEFYPQGVPSALEINGGTFTAIYLDRREPLMTPALSETSQ